VFDTAAGPLSLVPESLPESGQPILWWLQMPDPQLKPEKSDPIRLCELLSLREEDLDPSFPPMRTRDGDVLLVIRGWSRLMELTPDFSALRRWCHRIGIRGVSVATTETLSDSIDVQSRFFAPACGVDEDSVTGSVHGPLAVNLVINGEVGSSRGRSGLMCVQGKPGDRTGLVRALVEADREGYRAKVAGLCHTTLSGTVLVPPGN
jgi:PhzF family phenazine biosynthesis protein